MAGLLPTLIVVLVFGVSTVSCASNNTTQFDNFTIVWENFSVLSCAVPTPINVSLLVCLPPVTYLPLDDMTCLQQTMIDFDMSTCSSTGPTMLYSKGTTGVQQQTSTVAKTVATLPSTIAMTVATQPSTMTVSTASKPSTTMKTDTTGGVMAASTSRVGTTASSSTTTRVSTVVTASGSATVTVKKAASTSVKGPSTTATVPVPIAPSNIYTCQNELLGSSCNVPSDACAMLQPCQNAATCFPNRTIPSGYICRCQPGYAGDNCDLEQGPCHENSCWHNGTCIPMNATVAAYNGTDFRCECADGYNGVTCELKIDYCGNITCQNHGICQTVQMQWKCRCLDSNLYTGDYCQFKSSALKMREIISRSFAGVAIGAITVTCGFVVVMDILKYAFQIDPVECERESYRRRRDLHREARRPGRKSETKVALRFQYVA